MGGRSSVSQKQMSILKDAHLEARLLSYKSYDENIKDLTSTVKTYKKFQKIKETGLKNAESNYKDYVDSLKTDSVYQNAIKRNDTHIITDRKNTTTKLKNDIDVQRRAVNYFKERVAFLQSDKSKEYVKKHSKK